MDDEPRTAELTAEVLRRAGYLVEVAVSGTEALARVKLSAPDLMLLDYEMPDMDAPEVLDQLRSDHGRIAFPVIILTGARQAAGDQVVGSSGVLPTTSSRAPTGRCSWRGSAER